MKSRFVFSILGALVSLAGCGVSVTYSPTNTTPVPMVRKNPGEVAIFTTGFPNRTYGEVGILQAQHRNTLGDIAEVIEELREEAAKIGCDAVIIQGRADEVTGSVINGQGSIGVRQGVYGTCVVYLPDGDPRATGVHVGHN